MIAVAGLVVLVDRLVQPLLTRELSGTGPIKVLEGERAVLVGPWPPGRLLFAHQGKQFAGKPHETLGMEIERGHFDEATNDDLGVEASARGEYRRLAHLIRTIEGGRTFKPPTCQTVLEVEARDGLEEMHWSPGESGGPGALSTRRMTFVPLGGDALIRLTIGVPESTSSPGCERQLESGDDRSRTQAPLFNEITVADGAEVALHFYQADGPQIWKADGAHQPLDLGGSSSIRHLHALRVEKEDSGERLFEARGEGSGASVELTKLEVFPGRLEISIAGRGQLAGDRAPAASLFHRFKDHPFVAAFLALLVTALLSEIFKILKLPFGRRTE